MRHGITPYKDNEKSIESYEISRASSEVIDSMIIRESNSGVFAKRTSERVLTIR